MSVALAPPDSPFLCSWSHGGMDAYEVYVAGELDITTTPQLERALTVSHRILTLTGIADDVMITELAPGERRV